MEESPLQRIKPMTGALQARLCENQRAGINPTLFYSITIPLEPFDSGFEYEDQPVTTSFCLDFLKLPVADWRLLQDRSFYISPHDQDCSIYLGATHNRVNINRIKFMSLDGLRFRIACSLNCYFDLEPTANTSLDLTAEIEFQGLVSELDRGEPTAEEISRARDIASRLGKKDAKKYLREQKVVRAKDRALQTAWRLVDLTGYERPEIDNGLIVFKPKLR